MKAKKIVFVGTSRYAININDFFMFYTRSEHEIAAIFRHVRKGWWTTNIPQARGRIIDKTNRRKYKVIKYKKIGEVIKCLKNIAFDYVCMGNGSGGDQKKLVKAVGLDKCLFSEYGWLPWAQHFYISKGGCGFKSDIADIDEKQLLNVDIRKDEIENLKQSLNTGEDVPYEDYIYVPLQKDKNDFKFNFTRFKNNHQFLKFIYDLVPKDYPVLVKKHPLWKRQNLNLGQYPNFISDEGYNKYQLYNKMKAMICINSTSVLEGIMFEKPVFVYGKDLFLNKGVVNFDIEDQAEFLKHIKQENFPYNKRFISLILERQINRKRCVENDFDYINNHYWNTSI